MAYVLVATISGPMGNEDTIWLNTDHIISIVPDPITPRPPNKRRYTAKMASGETHEFTAVIDTAENLAGILSLDE